MKALIFAASMALILGLVHLLPEATRSGGVYLFDAFERGEAWRWLSAHLIHRDATHLWINLCTWGVGSALLAPVIGRDGRWLRGLLPIALAISISLSLVKPPAAPFVGSSALFYAWLVAGCVRGWRMPDYGIIYVSLCALLLLKGAIESLSGFGIGLGIHFEHADIATRPHQHALVWGLVWGVCSQQFRVSPRGGLRESRWGVRLSSGLGELRSHT